MASTTQQDTEPLFINPLKGKINFFDPAFFNIIYTEAREHSQLLPEETFNLELDLILNSFDPMLRKCCYYLSLEGLRKPNQSIGTLYELCLKKLGFNCPSTIAPPKSNKPTELTEPTEPTNSLNLADRFPVSVALDRKYCRSYQYHTFVVAGKDLRCGAELISNHIIKIDSLAAAEFYLQVNLKKLTCSGRWVNLIPQRCNWEPNKSPFKVSKPNKDQLMISIDEKNYVVLHLNILFKPKVTIEIFNRNLNKNVFITNKDLGIETRSLVALLQKFQQESLSKDKFKTQRDIYLIHSTNYDITFPFSTLLNYESDMDLLHNELIQITTDICDLCHSFDNMNFSPKMIQDFCVCQKCFQHVAALVDYISDINNNALITEKEGELGLLLKTKNSLNELSFELYQQFSSLTKKRRIEGNVCNFGELNLGPSNPEKVQENQLDQMFAKFISQGVSFKFPNEFTSLPLNSLRSNFGAIEIEGIIIYLPIDKIDLIKD